MFLKTSVDQNQTYLLTNIENYKIMVSSSLNEILNKYILVIVNYMKLFSEKINIKKYNYYKFIFTRGLDTITNVFKILLLFTKNIELTYYHSQKAFYFYIEFIEQISNDQNTFLQLSSREACMFVYKKTIFEINNDFKKNMEHISKHDKDIFDLLDKCLIIYKNICNVCIGHSDTIVSDKTSFIHTFSDKLKVFADQVNHNLGNDYLECIYLFVTYLLDKPISINNIFQSLHLFVKKITSNKMTNYCNLQTSIKKKQTVNVFPDNPDIAYNNPKLLVDFILEDDRTKSST